MSTGGVLVVAGCRGVHPTDAAEATRNSSVQPKAYLFTIAISSHLLAEPWLVLPGNPLVVAGFLYVTLIGIVPVWVCVAYLTLSALLVLAFHSIALLTLLEAPLTILLPILAFSLAPLWGWIYVAWGLVALVLDRRRLWVRIRILWDDVQRMRGLTDDDSPSLPPGEQVRNGS